MKVFPHNETNMNYLLVPSVRRSDGSGHIRRCLALAKRLGPDAAVFLPGKPEDADFRSASEIRSAFPEDCASSRIVEAIPSGARWDLVVLDLRKTPAGVLRSFDAKGLVVGLDEGGSDRASFPHLVDTLGTPPGTAAANLTDPGLLELPVNKRDFPERIDRVLVSFGGADLEGLGPAAVLFLVGRGFEPASVTLQLGALASAPRGLPAGVEILAPRPTLREELFRYDLVVTQYGLTAYEATWAGCAVLLLAPSPYHDLIARRSGFARLGSRRPRASAFARYLKAGRDGFRPTRALAGSASRTRPGARGDLASLLEGLDGSHAAVCPLCGSGDRKAVARYTGKTYFCCSSCGMLWMLNVARNKIDYRKEYFFEEYKKQYGKTYLEDFPNLVAMADRRLALLSPLVGQVASPSILDVGCAYGAFLSAARERGFTAFGMDVSEDAASWVRKELSIDAVAGPFEDFDPVTAFGGRVKGGMFDAVSLWYVIEHFPDVGSVLARINRMLPVGGVLAFSTPSGEGISARARFRDFLKKSPDDHYTVWEPSGVSRLLARYGFSVKRVVSTGHHPERFPFLGGRRGGGDDGAGPGTEPQSPANPSLPVSAARSCARAASVVFRLGDTFEVYATKEREV
jgi:2-polyprenyl-3-methyl-5-hydroxy-6-metoxy-1,4-benzoquinol methylase